MPGRLDLTVHAYERVPGSSTVRLLRTLPYVRVSQDAEAYFIQGGLVLTAGGDVIDELPGWFWEQVDRLTDATLAEVKFARRVVPPAPQPEPPSALWECPECHRTMPNSGRLAHEGFHARQKVKA